MTDPNVEDASGEETTQDAKKTPTPVAQGFRIGNVLKFVIPLLFVGGAIVAFSFFDGSSLVTGLMNPPLVMASGKIMYQGKPLEGAQITTRHANDKLPSSIGWTDDQGQFTLRTDLDGYIDGAYAGEHQVAITAYELTNTPSAPPLITPAKYASLGTSPLKIVVSRTAGENEYVITLEGDPPQRASRNRGGGSGAQGGGGGGFDPATIVANVFDEFDKDKDDKLSAEEMEAVETTRADRIRRADTNEDGIIQRKELTDALSAMRPPAQAAAEGQAAAED